jgi:hypothetical protein
MRWKEQFRLLVVEPMCFVPSQTSLTVVPFVKACGIHDPEMTEVSGEKVY